MTKEDYKQMSMPLPNVEEAAPTYKPDRTEERWLGLMVHHRRLFDALQDGWLRPQPKDIGLMLGAGAFTSEPGDAGKHTIRVRMKFDAGKLPSLDALVYRGEHWSPGMPVDVESSDNALYWPGALPTYAVSALSVATDEERVRLYGMARQSSNVRLPVDVTVDHGENDLVIRPAPPTYVMNTRIDIPDCEDAIHGAMTMAVWAVPRIDPWLDVLVASLSGDQEELSASAAKVKAEWWRVPPWAMTADTGPPDDLSVDSLQNALWQSAIEVFRELPGQSGFRPLALAEKIADGADSRFTSSRAETTAWLDGTRRILRAETTFHSIDWLDCPVGMAIQLVLARPEPTNFKTWHRDLHELPPSVWWSAAALCGLKHGYKRLDLCFRGDAPLQESLSVYALQKSTPDLKDLNWPSMSGEPSWRGEADGVDLLWGDKRVDHKPWTARGRWYTADFENEVVRREAHTVAKDLNWPCLNRELRLTTGQLSFAGSGEVAVSGRKIDIQGDIRLQLPTEAHVEDVLDVESFRYHVAVSADRLPEPPVVPTAELPAARLGVPGLTYVPNFLSDTEEAEIVAKIDRHEWSNKLKRRVQHYGWRYDYVNRQIDPGMRIDKLPDWAVAVAERLVERKIVPQMPDQLIVNEYVRDQGIGRHIDREPDFADDIAMISLLESWEMVFRKKDNNKIKYNVMLDNRSVAVMSGPARYQWTHEIPSRKSEPGPKLPDGKRLRKLRKRRLSLTFRKVLKEHLRQ